MYKYLFFSYYYYFFLIYYFNTHYILCDDIFIDFYLRLFVLKSYEITNSSRKKAGGIIEMEVRPSSLKYSAINNGGW